MQGENHRKRNWRWISGGIASALLIVGVVGVLVRSLPRGNATITIDSNGTARLGVLPLRNKTIRAAAFSAIGHLNGSNVSISVAESANFTNVLDTLKAMNQAGITSFASRVEQAPSILHHADTEIRAWIAKRTPLGLSSNEVRTIAQRQGWFRSDRQSSDGRTTGPFVRGELGHYSTGFLFTTFVTVFWEFDHKDRLASIRIWKTTEGL